MNNVAIVILNYNGREYLEKFLPGVVAHSDRCRVIVADNCSTDDSVAYLKTHHPEVELLLLPSNGGYSKGYNDALAQIEAEYYVLLNSDVDVTPGWVTPIIEMMNNDPDIAAAQPKILSYNQKTHFEYAGAAGGFIDTLGYPFCRGRLFLTLEEDQGQYNDDKQIFWATGACLFVRSAVFKQCGGLDNDFFAHMEEIDLCWRINNAGHKVMYCGKSSVYHVGGGTLHKANPRKTFLNFRNGLALLYKNYSTADLFLKLPVRILLDLVAAIKFMVFDSFNDGLAVFRAHIHFLGELKNNYKKRQETQKAITVKEIKSVYQGSVVWNHFIKGVKKFSELNPTSFRNFGA